MKKFIYFDVGGVLIKDFSGNDGMKNLKNAIGLPEKNELAFDKFFKDITYEICTSLDVDDLIPKLRMDFGITLSEDSSLLSAFVDRFERLDFMQDICNTIVSNYDSGLLTNMYPRMLDEIVQQGKMPNCNWKVIIDSSRVGVAKPEEEIFRLAEKRCERKPHDILFVDNTKEHLDAAGSLGWNTFLFDPKKAEESARSLLSYLNLAN